MKRKQTRHTSLTDKAAKVCRQLRRAGFHPHPGPISARGGHGGALRIKISAEPNRIRLRIAGSGVQEVFLYGPIVLNDLIRTVQDQFGKRSIESVIRSEM
ncbi:MAG: hypothetical protein HQL54_06955 [Magnetococcales bacterium]|nr:hypothetical protein [Magnetococcales bacterium]